MWVETCKSKSRTYLLLGGLLNLGGSLLLDGLLLGLGGLLALLLRAQLVRALDLDQLLGLDTLLEGEGQGVPGELDRRVGLGDVSLDGLGRRTSPVLEGEDGLLRQCEVSRFLGGC